MSGSDTKQSQEETILRLLAANHSLQGEIAALRERILAAHAMLRPATFWRGGDIYKPVVRLPELERWEAAPDVQQAVGFTPQKPTKETPNRDFSWFRGEVDRDLVGRLRSVQARLEEGR